MNGHPGGSAHTEYMIELAFLPKESRWLDMGAGDGSAVRKLIDAGYSAEGIDLEPRGENVIKGNFLHTSFEDKSFDGIISQCAFYSCGEPAQAFKEAARLLHKGGKLVFSDVCFDLVALLGQLRDAGFAIRHIDDLTPQWREYYLEALWREENVPTGKNCSYVLLVCERM